MEDKEDGQGESDGALSSSKKEKAKGKKVREKMSQVSDICCLTV